MLATGAVFTCGPVEVRKRKMSSAEQSRDHHHEHVRLELPTQSASNAALISLSAAFQSAVAIAVFPERLEADKADRLDLLLHHLLREAKSVPIEGMAEADQAAGVKAALTIIEGTIGMLR
jgi:hypothetical protein